MDNQREALESLVRLAAPPADPVNPGSPEQWDRVEHVLGTSLPADYKWLIDKYGSGDFGDLLIVLNPFAPAGGMNLLSQINFEVADRMNLMFFDRPSLQRYLEGRDGLIPEQCPFPAYPESGGLLPVASDTNGNDLFWVTEGHPDHWMMVHYNWRGGWEFEHYSYSLSEFLILWISGKLPESFFGVGNSEIVRRDPIFVPLGSFRL